MIGWDDDMPVEEMMLDRSQLANDKIQIATRRNYIAPSMQAVGPSRMPNFGPPTGISGLGKDETGNKTLCPKRAGLSAAFLDTLGITED